MATNKRWTEAERKFVEDHMQMCSDNDIAAMLSKITGTRITPSMIARQRRDLVAKRKKSSIKEESE